MPNVSQVSAALPMWRRRKETSAFALPPVGQLTGFCSMPRLWMRARPRTGPLVPNAPDFGALRAVQPAGYHRVSRGLAARLRRFE